MGLRLVLLDRRLERLAERAPEGIEARAQHLDETADVGRLGAIEVQARLEGVRIAAAVEQAERDQRVEEVARRARMERKPLAQRFAVERALPPAPRRRPARPPS